MLSNADLLGLLELETIFLLLGRLSYINIKATRNFGEWGDTIPNQIYCHFSQYNLRTI